MPPRTWKLPIRCGCFLAVLAAVASGMTSANALDPDRALSQALLRAWQAPQGLPRAAIFAVRQTHDGYLWLGTQAGLYRFDGVRFLPAKDRDGRTLPAVWVRDLCEDHDHRLWIATEDNGLLRLSEGKVTAFGRAEGLPSEHVGCVLVNRRGELWVGTDRGLARYRDGKFTTEAVRQSVHALAEGPDGEMWIAGADRLLLKSKGTEFQEHPLKSLPPQAIIQSLYISADQSIWVGSTAGLLRKNAEDERLFTAVDGLGSDVIHCLFPAGRGGLWAGTKDGLCRIQGDRIETFQTRDGLSQSTVFALCEDHEGSLWVGTKHGLNQFADRRTLLPFTVSEGLPSNDTGPILQDEAGDVWVGTLGEGLAKFDGRRFSSVAKERDGLPSDTILSLEDGGELGLWIGTDSGLCRRHAGQIVERFSTDDGLPSNRILCLARDAAGVLWVGTSAGVAALRDGRFVPAEGDASLLRKSIQTLVPRGPSLLAATTGGGLLRISDGRLTPATVSFGANIDIDAFYVDAGDRVWTALRGRGLGLIDGERTFTFGVKDGLFDDDIFGLVGDAKGRVWAACSRGIFSVPLEDLRKFAAGEIKRVTSTPFSPTDALRTIECQDGVQPAVWKMRDGRIWFSTIRGVIVIDPQRNSRTLPRPSILIDEVKVNGQIVDPKLVGRLPPGATNLDFHYSALSFVSTRTTYRYRLDGFDRDWVEAGARREAFYTNLSPGTYRFRVQATMADGAAYEAEHPVSFELAPYFYQTQWFPPLAAAGLVGLAWAMYRLRVGRMKARLQTIVAERSRIARELHDTLIQGFSGVTMQMQALAARLQPSSERATLNEIIHDAGGCLREARQSIAGLRNSRELESGLAAGVDRVARQLTDAGDVRLQLALGPVSQLPSDTEYNLLRIVQEAISNALKHADATLIDVTLRTEGQELELSVRDDGAGFDAERHIARAEPGHYGIIGMRERAAQIGARIEWRSAPGRGTTVIVRRAVPAAKSVEVAEPKRETQELKSSS